MDALPPKVHAAMVALLDGVAGMSQDEKRYAVVTIRQLRDKLAGKEHVEAVLPPLEGLGALLEAMCAHVVCVQEQRRIDELKGSPERLRALFGTAREG